MKVFISDIKNYITFKKWKKLAHNKLKYPLSDADQSSAEE